MAPRDNQRSRLYAAERQAFQWGQTVPDTLLQATVNDILDRKPVRSRFGPRRITVERGKGGGRAYGGGRITLGVSARTEWIICHEVAHCLTPGSYASHGPEYAGIYLFLISAVLGPKEAARLRDAFRQHKVKWNSKALPAPSTGRRIPPRQYETLAAARKRLKVRVATPEQSAARREAGLKAAATRKERESREILSFPLSLTFGKALAEEMSYQHDLSTENAECEGRPGPGWDIAGRKVTVDDADGLEDLLWRLDCATDPYWNPGLARAARSMIDRLVRMKRRTPAE